MAWTLGLIKTLAVFFARNIMCGMRSAASYWFIGVFFLFLVGPSATGQSGSGPAITIPGLFEGNVSSYEPFGLGSPNLESPVNGQAQGRLVTGRYQQIYDAGVFPGVLDITTIAFRADAGDAPGSGSSQLNNVFITLSLTNKRVEKLDAVFENNLTGPVTVVYSGPLRLNWSASIGPERPFDLRIPLQQSFRYDPSQGNLLLDVTVLVGNAGTPTLVLDAAENSGVTSQVSIESSSPTGWRTARGVTREVGLVTQFLTKTKP